MAGVTMVTERRGAAADKSFRTMRCMLQTSWCGRRRADAST